MSWRDKGRGGAPRRAESTWRSRPRQTRPSSQWQKSATDRHAVHQRLKLAGLALLSLCLLSALIAWILFVPRPVPLLVFSVTGFPHPLPPNALAREDAALFERTFQAYENVRYSADTDDYGSHDDLLGALKTALAAATAGGPERNAIVVYLSAHGIVNQQNQACLLLPSSNQDSATWLPLARVLQAVAEGRSGEPETQPAPHVLLLLDCGRMSPDPTLGYPYASFTDRVGHAVNAAAVPRLTVITSTGQGQQSHLLPEKGCSIFGYFVAAGLRGHARGDNHQVTSHELFRYLQNNVAAFADYYRARPQQPQMFPADAEDFDLAHVTGPTLPDGHQLTPVGDDDQLDELWSQLARLKRDQAFTWAPQVWSDVKQRLVRLEQLRLAGDAYQEQFETTNASVRADLGRLASYRLMSAKDCDSVALASQFAPVPDTVWTEARAKHLAWRQSLSAETPPDPPVTRPELPYEQAAGVAWNSAVSEGIAPSILDPALQLIAGAKPGSVPPVEYAEIQFLNILQQGATLSEPALPTDVIQRSLQVQSLAEQASVPSDVRGYRWLTTAIDRSDAVLRDGWDGLFVSSSPAVAQARATWDQLQGPDGEAGMLQKQLQIDRLVRSAYALRDQAWSELPFLMQWVARERQQQGRSQEVTADTGQRPDSLAEMLGRLVRNTHRLGRQLEQVPANLVDLDGANQLTRAKDDVALVLRPLQTAFRDACRTLWVENARDVQSISAMGDLLAVPLIPGDVQVRNDLRRRYYQHRLDQDGAVSQLEALAKSGGKASTAPHAKSNLEQQPSTKNRAPGMQAATPAPSYLDWLVTFQRQVVLPLIDREHVIDDGSVPSVRLIDPPSITAESDAERRARQLEYLADVGGELRDQLSDLGRIITKQMSVTVGHLQDASRDWNEVRQGVSRADRLARAASAWRWPRSSEFGQAAGVGSVELSQQAPGPALHRLDAHYLLTDRARRRLADAWGDGQAQLADGDPYFSRVSQHLLSAASGLLPTGVKYREATQATIDERVDAFRQWRLTAPGLQLAGDEQSVRHATTMQQNQSLPEGVGALFLSDALGNPVAVENTSGSSGQMYRLAAKLSATEPIRYRIPINASVQSASLMEASLFFRGHLRKASFLIDTEDNATVSTLVRRPPPPPSILVEGDSRQISQIVFVLDCSASMRFLHDQEGRLRERLDLAIDAVRSILETLDQRNFHVGLVLYGHRAGWNSSNDVQHRWPDETPHLHPGSDVEIAVPLTPVIRTNRSTGRLEDVRFEFYDALSNLKPYGETPLYYAITQALDQLDPRTPGARTVIVITDGVNTQSVDPRRSTKRDKSDVQQKLDDLQTPARIEIIGIHAKPSSFANERDRTDWEKHEQPRWEGGQKKDLQDLATRSGGGFHDITRIHTLRRVLRESLRLTKYYVRDSQGNTFGGNELGQEWRPVSAESLNLPATFEVGIEEKSQAVTRTRVQLHGGEAIRMVYNQQTGRLEHQRFDEELAGRAVKVRTDPDHWLHVAPHIPRTVGNSLSELIFRVSVQNGDPTRFSTRPVNAWAEIRPLMPGAGTTTQPHLNYDLRFESGQPVPVMLFQVAGWPAAAERAEMNVWFEMPRADSAQRLGDKWQRIPLELDFEKQQTAEVPLQDPNRAIAATDEMNSAARLVIKPQVTEQRHLRIQVEEDFQVSAQNGSLSSAFPLMVEIWPTPDAVRRTFLNDSQRVKHIFVYRDLESLRTGKVELRVLRQADLKRTWYATGPISVQLPLR